jgi:hypothetical protein
MIWSRQLGLAGISKSTVSKLCKEIDERVSSFLERPLEGEWPYLWLDATYLKVREGGWIVPVAAIIAVDLSSEGKREIVGLVGIFPGETSITELIGAVCSKPTMSGSSSTATCRSRPWPSCSLPNSRP